MAYTPPVITGYNADPPSDNGEQTSANIVSWATIKTKLADAVKTFVEVVIARPKSRMHYNFIDNVGGFLSGGSGGDQVESFPEITPDNTDSKLLVQVSFNAEVALDAASSDGVATIELVYSETLPFPGGPLGVIDNCTTTIGVKDFNSNSGRSTTMNMNFIATIDSWSTLEPGSPSSILLGLRSKDVSSNIEIGNVNLSVIEVVS